MVDLSGRYAIQIVTGHSDGSATIQTWAVNEQMVAEVRETLGSDPISEYIAPVTDTGFEQRVEL